MLTDLFPDVAKSQQDRRWRDRLEAHRSFPKKQLAVI